MMEMFTRRCQLPDRSFFLFGPRGTGKTTWMKVVLPEALWFDLPRIHPDSADTALKKSGTSRI
jgi:hypothetical protein